MSHSIIVNQNIIDLEYAVRGPIPQRAAELKKQGRKIIPCNIGNPQALGQPPLSYYRSVIALLEDPEKINRERFLKTTNLQGIEYVSDHVLDTCEEILRKTDGGLGAYTESKGFYFVREAVADFINLRDGFESNHLVANPEYIFITDGASEGAKLVLELIIADKNDGIMVPIPQYPLYSATIKRCGGTQVNYYPDEDRGWLLDKDILDESIKSARASGINVKAIVVINPANPTGAILDRSSVEAVIDFAHENRIAIIADEVYQDNLYGKEFFSFAKAVGEKDICLFSLHSVSKGFYGECGHRGGYLEIRNPLTIANSDMKFIDAVFKLASVNLCSNIIGQVLVYLMTKPPSPENDTYAQFEKERKSILNDLYDKATIIKSSFQQMNGMECFGNIGALYLFPRINKLPIGKNDFDYCMSLLEETNLCVVNGSGFGQKEGTHHLRIAFLPSKELLEEVLPQWIKFHNDYVTR
ncbi:aminotransferase class I/II-fold pyridoxal phosphate-dependent enzyme [Candidatus Neomarinimicrobiota bacterium]